MDSSDFKYANIGIAVGVAVLVIGVFALKDSGEGAQQFLGIGAFVAAMAVYVGLSERARRRKRDQ